MKTDKVSVILFGGCLFLFLCLGIYFYFREETDEVSARGVEEFKNKEPTLRDGIQAIPLASPSTSHTSDAVVNTEPASALAPKQKASQNEAKDKISLSYMNPVTSIMENDSSPCRDSPQRSAPVPPATSEVAKDGQPTLQIGYLKRMEEHFEQILQNLSDNAIVEMYKKLFNGEIIIEIDRNLGGACEQVSNLLRTFLEKLIREAIAAEPLDLDALAILKDVPFQFYKKAERLNGKNPYALYYKLITFEELVAELVGQMITLEFGYEPLEDVEKMLQQAFTEFEKKQSLVEKLAPLVIDIKSSVAEEYSNVMYMYMFKPVIEEMLRLSLSKADMAGLIQKTQSWMAKYSIHPTLPYMGIALQLDAPISEVTANFARIYLPNPSLTTKTCDFAALTAQVPPRSVNNASAICYAISLYQCFATFCPLIKKHAAGTHPKSKSFLDVLEELNKPGTPLEMSSLVNLPSVGYPFRVLYKLIDGFTQDQAATDDFNWHHLLGITNLSKLPNLLAHEVAQGMLESQPVVVLDDCLLKGPILIVDAEGRTEAIPKDLEMRDMTGESRKYGLWAMLMGGNGHFAAFVRRANTWYHCDDALVAPISVPPLNSSQWSTFGRTPYFCFYLLK